LWSQHRGVKDFEKSNTTIEGKESKKKQEPHNNTFTNSEVPKTNNGVVPATVGSSLSRKQTV